MADLACGGGEAGLAIAAEFLDVLVDGFDTDPARVAEAELRAAEAGLEARARFRLGDAALLRPAHYELILVVDAGPPEALVSVRAALAEEGGAALVARPPAEQPKLLRERATAAGFAEVEDLPLEDGAVRLFALRTS